MKRVLSNHREVEAMNEFKLEPADILVTVSTGKDPFSIVKRWTLGSPYEHVFMYMGKVRLIVKQQQRRIMRFPLLYESNGRGVVLQALSNRYGEEVVVMRLKSEFDRKRIPHVLEEAVKLASDERARYDYWCIFQFILPRLICEKMPLFIQQRMPLKWHRNPWHVCSEATFEIFYRAKLVDILPLNPVPLPGDFVTDSLLLEEAWTGKLSEDLV